MFEVLKATKSPREVTFNCFPLDLKSCCFVIFVLSCYCSLVHTDSRARRNVGVRLANNDQKKQQSQKPKGQMRLSHRPYIYNAHTCLNASPCPAISTQSLPPCQVRNVEGQQPFPAGVPPGFLRKIRRWYRNWECPSEARCCSHLENLLEKDQVWNSQVLNFMLYCNNLVGFFPLHWFGDHSKMRNQRNCNTAVFYY